MLMVTSPCSGNWFGSMAMSAAGASTTTEYTPGTRLSAPSERETRPR